MSDAVCTILLTIEKWKKIYNLGTRWILGNLCAKEIHYGDVEEKLETITNTFLQRGTMLMCGRSIVSEKGF